MSQQRYQQIYREHAMMDGGYAIGGGPYRDCVQRSNNPYPPNKKNPNAPRKYRCSKYGATKSGYQRKTPVKGEAREPNLWSEYIGAVARAQCTPVNVQAKKQNVKDVYHKAVNNGTIVRVIEGLEARAHTGKNCK